MSTYKKFDSTQGLIFVYADPGHKVPEEEFNDWYDNEHIPPRLNVPGIMSSSRYKTADSQSPFWLALYDITSTDVVQSPEYKALIPNGSKREKEIMANLGNINRRVYDHIISFIHPKTNLSSLPGRYAFIVHMKVTLNGEDEFNRWYNEEHMVLLSKIPGWLCGRRYKLVESVSRGVKLEPEEDVKPQAEYLAIHELEMHGFMGLPEFNAAIQTPWRERVMKTVTYTELRLFERYKVFKTVF